MGRKRVSTGQREAVALALAAGKSQSEAAREGTVASSTVSAWLREPEFQGLLEQIRDGQRVEVAAVANGLILSALRRAGQLIPKAKDLYALTRVLECLQNLVNFQLDAPEQQNEPWKVEAERLKRYRAARAEAEASGKVVPIRAEESGG